MRKIDGRGKSLAVLRILSCLLIAVATPCLSPVIAQTPVSAEFSVHKNRAFPQGYQDVAVSLNGESLVVWQSITPDGKHDGLWAQWYSSQGEPIGPNKLLRSVAGQGFNPIVAPGTHGGVLLLWRETRRTAEAEWDVLIGGELLPDGSWVLPPRYLTFLGAILPRFAAPLPQGGYAITLLGFRPNHTETRTFLLFLDKNLKVVRGPSRVHPTSRATQEVGGLAVSPTGAFLVTWTEAEFAILAQLFSPVGRPVAPAFKVPEERPVQQQYAGAAAALGNQGYVIVWSEDDPETGTPDLAMRLLKPDGTPRSSNLRLDPEVRFRGLQEVAADTAGNFVVVWQEGGPPYGSWDIWGRAYHPDGTPYGPKVRLNEYIINDQTMPQIAFAPNGTFVVVWQSFGQDGDREGVYGRIFSLTQSSPSALPSPSGH